jgi:endonuclease/exonuclease/phosphatase (EEP) superfamily protein YafD
LTRAVQLLRIMFVVGAVGVAALTATAFLARWTQPFEIFSHFRLHYAFAGAGLIVALVLLKQQRAAMLAARTLVANIIAIGAALTGSAETTAAATTTRIIWANLQRRQASLDAIATLARSERADIVALTELPSERIEAVRRAFPDFACFIADAEATSPTATLVASRLPCTGGAAPTTLRPYAAQYADIGAIRIAAVHGRPPWNNERTLDRDTVNLAGANIARAHPHAILVGDFNATPWSPHLLDLRRMGFRRVPCGGPLTRTWRSQEFPFYALPIDHVLVTPSVRVASCRVGAGNGSDHHPLIVEIATP